MSSDLKLPRPWLLRALELETGRQLGPTRFSLEAVRAFLQAVEESRQDPAVADEDALRLAAYVERLRSVRPGDGALAARLRRCAAALDHGREAARAEAEAVLSEADTTIEALVRGAESLFRPGLRVLTHSYSETVLRLLTHYADRLEAVTVCESRPLNEGVRTASELAALALPVRLITEAQLEVWVGECDLSLAGAVRVLPDGAVAARAGTALLARVGAAHRVPFYVAADRAKWVSEEDEPAATIRVSHPPREVLADPPAGVEVVNVPYDLTPGELVTGFLTEEGIR